MEDFFQAPAFQSVPVASDLALMQARVNGSPVQMQSAAWQNERFGYVRLTFLVGLPRIEMLNLTIYPRFEYDIPIFATDIVVLNGRLRVAVIDAMPLFPEEPDYYAQWIAPFEPLYRQSLTLAPAYDRKLDWSFHYLGPYACLITQLPAENFESLFQLWSAYFERYRQAAAQAVAISDARRARVQAWHTDYNDKHAAVESKRNPLLHYFGEALGLRYIRDFLFTNHR